MAREPTRIELSVKANPDVLLLHKPAMPYDDARQLEIAAFFEGSYL